MLSILSVRQCPSADMGTFTVGMMTSSSCPGDLTLVSTTLLYDNYDWRNESGATIANTPTNDPSRRQMVGS